MNRSEDAKLLLLDIVRCDVARSHFSDSIDAHPCSTIVAAQGVMSWASFQVPEPWSGNLLTAPILFLSSNPSISGTEEYPRSAWGNSELESFFNSRFNGHWIRNDNSARNADGTYGGKVHYWSSIRNRASELLGRSAIPGVDFALSEIVHCKSKGDAGAELALKFCAGRYLLRLLSCSGAIVHRASSSPLRSPQIFPRRLWRFVVAIRCRDSLGFSRCAVAMV